MIYHVRHVSYLPWKATVRRLNQVTVLCEAPANAHALEHSRKSHPHLTATPPTRVVPLPIPLSARARRCTGPGADLWASIVPASACSRITAMQQLLDMQGRCGRQQHVLPTSHFTPNSRRCTSTMRRSRSTRIRSDVVAAARLTLNAVQSSTDVFPPVKSAVSAVIVLLEMSERIKSNRKGCERIAQRSAQLVQDLWRQIKDFDVELPAEVKTSVVEIENLFQKIQIFFDELQGENIWQRLARQERNNSQIAEFGRLLNEAIWDLSINLQLGAHRLHVEFVAADEKRHDGVLAVSQMSEAERLICGGSSDADFEYPW
ncbi:hypothetical protein C8F01DRAFT_1234215 [Mycena amicta]|nr:hypothetical protein C8F01DRAFT_1234215 [Mycena amicta]